MIVKTNKELFHEFYAKHGHEFPEVDIEQSKEAAFAPWRFLKKEMEVGDLETVRLKYFGTFQVYTGRAKRMLQTLKDRLRFHKIDKLQYQKLSIMLDKFLKRRGNGEV